VPATVTDWRELIERDDVDMVDICTPPGTHAEMAQQAAAAGKAVLCEKPLALNYPEAATALAAVTVDAGFPPGRSGAGGLRRDGDLRRLRPLGDDRRGNL
jgi:Oxidoreductase family, NAD-binding Rossmann fold